jgi:two-component system response regulator RegX3
MTVTVQKTGGPKPRVLVVDDEVGVRESLKYLLKNEYDVVLAEDGPRGLEKFAEGKFDLAIVDGVMPGMTGTEVIREIRRANQRVPIIMLTAHNTRLTDGMRTTIGASEFMDKPFDVHTLSATVARLIQQRSVV